jgi:CRISPR-associated protein Csb1
MQPSNGTINYQALSGAPRLLMECDLKPLQGDRFQPTGFADLGPARYTRPDGTEMLLVESAQSVANRMELACWDDATQDLIESLRGLPYIRIFDEKATQVSNSLLEAHRINSEYIMKGAFRITWQDDGKARTKASESFNEELASEIEYQKDSRVNWRKFHDALLKYDPNSLVHGCFLEEIGGRLRATRALSGFIEATDVSVAESGGVKNNIVQPELKGGEGNVPFHRTEFVANKITAYFNLDMALLRGYGLPEEANNLMIALALLKIRRFLSLGLRLRTACDLEPTNGGLKVMRPDGFTIPDEGTLLEECKRLIGACADKGLFAKPPITEVEWKSADKGKKAKESEASQDALDDQGDSGS